MQVRPVSAKVKVLTELIHVCSVIGSGKRVTVVCVTGKGRAPGSNRQRAWYVIARCQRNR